MMLLLLPLKKDLVLQDLGSERELRDQLEIKQRKVNTSLFWKPSDHLTASSDAVPCQNLETAQRYFLQWPLTGIVACRYLS